MDKREVDIVTLFNMIFARKGLIIGLIVAGLVGGVLYGAMRERSYEFVTVIEPGVVKDRTVVTPQQLVTWLENVYIPQAQRELEVSLGDISVEILGDEALVSVTTVGADPHDELHRRVFNLLSEDTRRIYNRLTNTQKVILNSLENKHGIALDNIKLFERRLENTMRRQKFLNEKQKELMPVYDALVAKFSDQSPDQAGTMPYIYDDDEDTLIPYLLNLQESARVGIAEAKMDLQRKINLARTDLLEIKNDIAKVRNDLDASYRTRMLRGPAKRSLKPVGSGPIKLAVAGAVGGLALGIVLVFAIVAIDAQRQQDDDGGREHNRSARHPL